jgi:hypothetical protein
MAAVLKMFNSSIHEAMLGNITWSGVEVMMCLMTAYTYDETDATYTQVVIDHTEHTTANGYTVGGVVAATPTHGIAAGVVLFGTDPVVWTATGALTATHALCYDLSSKALIFCIDLDGAGGNVTATDAAFTITNASGYFSVDTTP